MSSQHGVAWRSTLKKIFFFVTDKNQKRRESMPAPDLRTNGERLETLGINDAYRYPGGTGNRDMSITLREVVCEKGGSDTRSNQKPPADARTFC